MVAVGSLTHELVKYSNPRQDLTPTDLSRIEATTTAREEDHKVGQRAAAPEGASGVSGVCDGHGVEVDNGNEDGTDKDEDSLHLAVRVAFSLPPSSYATMLLRELMKSTTSTQAHISMSKSVHHSALS